MSTSNPFGTIDNANADEAYERVLPEAMKVRPESLLVINIDVLSSVFTVMGVLEKLPPFYDAFKQLSGFPVEQVEKLPDYTLAMYSAQLRYTFATTPPEDIPVLVEEATKWRDILLADAKALIARGQLKAELLKELTGVHGYRNVTVDLSGLTTIFKSSWAEYEGHVGLTRDDLTVADRVAMKLAGAVAHRENSPEMVTTATDIRQRVFTLYFTAYDQVRRGLRYVRWDEGDADILAPSLYAGRTTTRAVKKQEDESAGDTKTTEVGAKATGTTVQAAEPLKVPVGHPGGEPLGPA